MKPIVYKNFNNNVYLQFQEDEEFDYFVRLHTGQVEITKLRKNETAQLQLLGTDQIHSPAHCAQIFLESTLPKTERATKVLSLIQEGKDLPKFVGLEGSTHGTTEASKLTSREKMDIVGKGAAEIAKRVRRRPEPEQPTGESAPAARTKRAAGTNQVTLADICAKLGVDPSEARKAIRGANWTKPGGSWTWDTTDAERVQADLAKLMEK